MIKPSSKYILEFYKGLEKHGIENHGLLIMKGEETVFEEYQYPYSADMPHTLFSVTKSIVATAVGFAIDEGLFTLDTKIIDIFPEYEACKSDEWENLTVKSVLTMNSNKKFSFLQDMTGNYVEMFMKADFRKDKGFLYSNNDAHIAAAIVHKKSGMTVAEYLRPRLFEPLEIDAPFWETNSIGECIGGTGCYLKLRDLAKICRCYGNGGKYNGLQIIPEWWTKEATKIQHPFKKGKGYGYLFWIENGAFSMTGMFGQVITYFPQYDAVTAVMNCGIDEGSNERLIYTVLTKAFEEESTDEWDNKLKEYLEERNVKPVACSEKISVPQNKKYYLTAFSDALAKFMFPQSLIPRSVSSSFAKRCKKNLNEVSFSLTDDVLTVKWKEGGDTVTVNCGLDGEPRLASCEIKGYPYKIWAYAYVKEGKINAVIKPINTLATQYFTFDFQGDALKMQIKGTPSYPEFILKNAVDNPIAKKSKVVKKAIIGVMKPVLATTERVMTLKSK